MQGRKQLPRCTTFNTDNLICSSRGPTGLSPEQLAAREKIVLTRAELQTLVDKDSENKTMSQSCMCMGVSKTVYAGIYASARRKLTQSLIQGAVLMIECQD